MVNEMEEGRTRVWGIIAVILVARHLKTTGDLHDSRPSPRTESLVASAAQCCGDGGLMNIHADIYFS